MGGVASRTVKRGGGRAQKNGASVGNEWKGGIISEIGRRDMLERKDSGHSGRIYASSPPSNCM